MVILLTAIVTNVTINLRFPESSGSFPFIGSAVGAALLLSTFVRLPNWEIVPEAAKAVYSCCLSCCARH
jgi:hypothetical protein